MSEVELQKLRNYRRISTNLATAGQPEADQFSLLARHFDCIINLALPDSPHALPDEASLTEQYGLRYVSIPVDFKHPLPRDFERFCNAMRDFGDKRVLTHCAMNWRVSSFVYLYRILELHTEPDLARQDLDAVWQPDAVWSDFIENLLNRNRR